MRLVEVDETLARLSAAIEAMTANLFELDENPTNKLLDASTTTGLTHERVTLARDSLASIWEHFGAIKDVVARAKVIRGDSPRLSAGKLAELEQLLRGASIPLPPLSIPLAQRGLYSPNEQAMATTPDRVLTDMAAAFDAAKGVILAVDEVWRTLVPRVEACRLQITALETLLTAVDEAAEGLQPERATVDDLSRRIADDPLAVDAASMATVEAGLATLRARLQRRKHDRDTLEQDLRTAGETLAELSCALDDGAAALAECRAKIAHPSGLLAAIDRVCLTGRERGLGPWLDRLRDLAGAGDWRAAIKGIDEWQRVAAETSAAAAQVIRANRAPIDARNELRGRLDALAAKAARFGLTEDPELSATHERARDLLYEAPTDLQAAARLVADYGTAVAGHRTGRRA